MTQHFLTTDQGFRCDKKVKRLPSLFYSFFVCGFVIVFANDLSAQTTQHGLIRRISVFPLKVDDVYRKIGEDVWWTLREQLTKDQRFLVASRYFLIQKDVFQPRGELSPKDAVILGGLLDANALITVYLVDRDLTLAVYDGEFGRTLWRKTVSLQVSVPIKDQLEKSAVRLLQEFMAAVPYQGFVVTDPILGKPTFVENALSLVKMKVGVNSAIAVGDNFQIFRLYSRTMDPLFLEGSYQAIVAEGRVTRREGDDLVVGEILRIKEKEEVNDFALVRFPNEERRLRESLGIGSELDRRIIPEFAQARMQETKRNEEEKRPLMTAIAFIANIAAFLLLAF